MPLNFMEGPEAKARRALFREELHRFGSAIPWLQDHSLIPGRAVDFLGPDIPNPYTNVASWMIHRLGAWSAEVHSKLSFSEVFNKYNLNADSRVEVRTAIGQRAAESYGPGIAAMSELFQVVPVVATREGLSRDTWLPIASATRKFGELIARNGTHTQAIARSYLGGGANVILGGIMDVSMLRLDTDTGITTVTPIEDIVAAADEIARQLFEHEDHSGVCVGLQTSLPGLDGVTPYDAVWDAYGYAAEHYLYPGVSTDTMDIQPVATPDGSLVMHLAEIATQDLKGFPELFGV